MDDKIFDNKPKLKKNRNKKINPFVKKVQTSRKKEKQN